ncbi:hypothetical protein Lal_00015459 [Lupinus albus]|nr:hypothetical protein Lal_00015459 [Lupinus albus]
MPETKINELVTRTQNGGAEIVSLLKTGSAYYGPGRSVAQMVESILRDQKRLLPCAVYADGDYGLKDVYIGLPAVLGRNGVEKIVDINLLDDEKAALKKSADSIKENVDLMNKLLVADMYNLSKRSLLGIALVLTPLLASPVRASDNDVASPAPFPALYDEVETSATVKARQEIQSFLTNYESLWNAHNLAQVMDCYAHDYINNDGLDKDSVSKLTQDFWQTYPDAKSQSTIRQIRIDNNYATVQTRDVAIGTSNKDNYGFDNKGELQSISEGQLYLRKYNDEWRIVEQVKSGRQYSARIEINLPPGLYANGNITCQTLKFPQSSQREGFRPLESTGSLERVIQANEENRNELLTATITLSNISRSNLKGLAFVTRRVNIIPQAQANKQKSEPRPESESESEEDLKPEESLEQDPKSESKQKPESN